MPDQDHTAISFRLWQPEDEESVPFALLAHVMNGMQQVIYLLAMSHEKGELRGRLRLPAEFIEKYALHALPSRKGSYVQKAVLGPGTSSKLFDSNDLVQVVDSYRSISDAIVSGDFDAIRQVIPERKLRRRTMSEYRLMLPPDESKWRMDVRVEGTDLEIKRQAVDAVIERLEESDRDNLVDSVVGKLVGIDFDRKKIVLFYPPTRKKIQCFYEEAIEDLLLRNPREFVRVVGRITVDNEGYPQSISGVEDIQEVDLSPYRVEQIRVGQKRLRFDPPLLLPIELDESYQFLTAIDKELGIDGIAATRESLIELIEEEIAMLWENYALADDSKLTPKAQQRKRALLARISEESHAT